jgi:hypothetical protein
LAFGALPSTAPRADEVDGLLARLARPAPARTAFVEVRYSKLLSAPLVTAGELEFRGPGELGKHVERPYRENTQIHGEDVQVEREGQRPRRFSLKRAPELRGLLVSFGALLGGDRAGLEQYFELSTETVDGGWRLQLTPRDVRTRKRIRSVVVQGRTSEPRCFVISERDDNASVLLVGAAAAVALPKAPSRDWLDNFCRAGDGA